MKQELTHEQRAQVLRQQQQRLLLLRHSSKCPAGTPQNPEKCRATPHCAQMKQLWQHIAKCKDQRCATSHCVSSRYVLSHYHRCNDQLCMVCLPVRQEMKRDAVKRGGHDGGGGGAGGGTPGSAGEQHSAALRKCSDEPRRCSNYRKVLRL